jgi:hypothetical protein
MITTTGRFPEEPLPRLGSDGAEAPEFSVTFSRRPDTSTRSSTRPNSFRWSGNGIIRVMERGLVVIAKRRSALGFHTTEQRLVPAWEISDVYREGTSVRVDLRSDPPHREFFQFWAGDASTAGTIVRLLPTKRTIEYEGPPAGSGGARSTTESTPKNRVIRTDVLIPAALVVVLIGMAALLTIPKLRDYISPPPVTPSALTASPVQVVGTVPVAAPDAAKDTQAWHPTDLEITNARLALAQFDERMDGLHAQFKMAFVALQHGELSKQDFIDGVNRWLLPQWDALYSELATRVRGNQPPGEAVSKRLMKVALGWDGALRAYVQGLKDGNSDLVVGAVGQMSDANAQQRAAWSLIERAQP